MTAVPEREPAGPVSDYNPNIRWGVQHVQITLMCWDRSATHVVPVGGNCRGFTVIEAAISSLYESLPIHPESDAEFGDMAVLTLTGPDGGKLDCIDYDVRGEDWLKDLVVSAQIIRWDPPTVNEVRAMTGAEPIEGGDAPWQPICPTPSRKAAG